MRTFTLEYETTIDRPLAEVFPFFSRPENLARITPPAMGFDILTPSPIEMKSGAVIDYTVKVLGLRVHWRTLISDYNPPHGFVDQQLKGPYVLWHHTHTFREANGKTIMGDRVVYALPFGWLGRLVHRLFVRSQLERIFQYRSKVIHRVFAPSVSPPEPKSIAG
jgi:ligand-binding SRPBCC domain-containing protein